MRPTPGTLLSSADLPAFLMSDLTNIRYVTGLSLSAGLVLVTPRAYVLFVDPRYKTMADRAAGPFLVRDHTDLPEAMRKVRICGCEAEEVTLQKMSQWKKKFANTKFVRTVGVVQAFRRQKSEEELTHMRRAQRLTRELLRRVPSALRKQTTEKKLAQQLLFWALELGAEGLSFEPIVAFGTNTAIPHHHPTTRTLKKGHIVQIDVGVKINGYCGDMSEVYFTAPPTSEQKRLYKALQEAQNKAMDAIRPGVTTHQLDMIARTVLQSYRVESAFTHSLGHGIGLDVHEGVTLSQRAPAEKLLKNEVITIEPGVYFPGTWGMRVEEMVIVG